MSLVENNVFSTPIYFSEKKEWIEKLNKISDFYILEAKNKILTDKIIEKNEIEESTRYHDYNSNKVQPYVNIDVVGYINIYDVYKNGSVK